MRTTLARWLVLGMVVLAIVVHIGVWGMTKIQTDGGSLLESWRPYFGWEYGVLFAGAQAGLCLWLPVQRGIVWLSRTWGITGAAILVLWLITGRSGRMTFDSGVAVTAGMGALILAAALYEGDLRAGSRRRARGHA